MQAGFGLVESSFTRKMNSANIMTKNMMDLVMSAFVYVFLGYARGAAQERTRGRKGSCRADLWVEDKTSGPRGG